MPQSAPRTALAIRHIHFEGLGLFAPVLAQAGYDLTYHDVGADPLEEIDPSAPDLLVVLGGPVGVYEGEAYPFLETELSILKARLQAGRPTLGLCLGAQLMAFALGAKVAPMGHKEIGFGALTLTDAGQAGPLRHLANVPVLHWHGDAFETPPGAENLATTTLCATQAFALGPNILGLQCHPEVDAQAGIERWLIGHAAELAGAGISSAALRAQAADLAASTSGDGARAMLRAWLEGLSDG
ncbi:glutamine amidotransferase [Novosphingobium terrae]|uniref:glutamine amidotransferase n=1 Tax=Novosphingobium terrae TaxID=2726189 RepID=UPI00197EB464|nr:glutamine amidotransferase [Novosphingobium terrae]